MKTLFYFVLQAVFCLAASASIASPLTGGDTITILEAKKRGALAVWLRGAYNPTRPQRGSANAHFGECIDIKLKNVTDSVLNVLLPCGTMLLSQDSSVQAMLVTESIVYRLLPRQKFSDRLYAMCGELHKNAPDIYVHYEVGPQVPGHLLRLARVIEETGAQNKAGQYAVWAVTDNATVDDLGEDFATLNESQELLNKAAIGINITVSPKVALAQQGRANTRARQKAPADKALPSTEAPEGPDNEQLALAENTQEVQVQPTEGEIAATTLSPAPEATAVANDPGTLWASQRELLPLYLFSLLALAGGSYLLLKQRRGQQANRRQGNGPSQV